MLSIEGLIHVDMYVLAPDPHLAELNERMVRVGLG